MYLSDPNMIVRREQCRDLQREAERERLARLALSTARTVGYRKALHWLGGRLQAWGHGLMDLGTTPTYNERPASPIS
jgi:CelD/BcsL family acetyltransferase involved in cellulose biosynthesis